MVQFNEYYDDHRKQSCAADEENAYWKLGDSSCTSVAKIKEYLEDRDVYLKSGIRKDRALELLGRYQRGLLYYAEFSVAKLRVMAKNRGLAAAAVGGNKTQITQALERSDEQITLPILKLLSELRDMIYTFYFDSLDDLPARFKMPPLTRVAELREEARKIFYRRCTFTFTFAEDDYFVFAPEYTMPKSDFSAAISRFNIQLQSVSLYYFKTTHVYAKWFVDLNSDDDGGKDVIETVVETDRWLGNGKYPCPHEHLNEVVKSMAARPNHQKFSGNDIETIRGTFVSKRRSY